MHAHAIVPKRMDGRDASFVRVRGLLFCQMVFSKLNYLYPDSMSNLSIKSSAIETLPKSSSLKRSLGNFCTSSSSPFPKAMNLKQRSLKMFVLRLFGKFMPTFKACCRFHPTHRVGPWTLLTSNPSNALSAVLKTGGNGGWLTAVAHWHMRYLLRRISWWRRDRASELCVNSFALRVAKCLAHHHRAPSSHIGHSRHRHTSGTRAIVTHWVLAPFQLVHSRTLSNFSFTSSCRPPPLRPLFTDPTPRITSLRHPYAPGPR
jgi:hypothetical protein